MSRVALRIPTPLRRFADGAAELELEANSIRHLFEVLQQHHPELRDQILTPEGEPRHFVNIYLESDNINTLQGMATPLPEAAVVSVIPAVAGGG